MKAWLTSLLLFAVNVAAGEIRQLPFCKEDSQENVASDKGLRRYLSFVFHTYIH